MLKPNFTPGPWKVEESTSAFFYILAGSANWDKDSTWVGSVDFRNDQGGFPLRDAAEANANLIASSPELYSDALDTEHAYSWLMQELRDLQHDGASWPAEKIGLFADSLIAYCDAHQIGTRAALAKADGKEAL